MARNGSGTYSLPSGNPVVTATAISSSDFNDTMTDIATALTNSLARNGEAPPTANQPFGGYKITGLAIGTAKTDGMSLANQQAQTAVYCATVGGTADVITLTPSPALTAYAAGNKFFFIASGANTTNVTVNVSGLGAKAITKRGSTALVANDIISGALVGIQYDGTRFQIITPIGAALGDLATQNDSDNLTLSGNNTMAGNNNITITAGTITGITDLDVADGGTGASTAADAFTNLKQAASASATGVVELATEAEVQTGTDTARVASVSTMRTGFRVIGTMTSVGTGTTANVGSIPSWVTEIKIVLSAAGFNGTNNMILQLGDSGGIEATGYVDASSLILGASAGAGLNTTSFVFPTSSSGNLSGVITLSKGDTATELWGMTAMFIASGQGASFSAGEKTLSGVLTQVQIGSSAGNSFDTGSWSVSWS